MTGDAVKTAQVQIGGNFNEPYVSVELNAHGSRVFDQVTRDNVGRQLAIVLDNVVQSAPVIQERISGGHAQITGSFSMDEAADLAIVLQGRGLAGPGQYRPERDRRADPGTGFRSKKDLFPGWWVQGWSICS